ncbi:unnamed protein product [Victoria cruziana]
MLLAWQELLHSLPCRYTHRHCFYVPLLATFPAFAAEEIGVMILAVLAEALASSFWLPDWRPC